MKSLIFLIVGIFGGICMTLAVVLQPVEAVEQTSSEESTKPITPHEIDDISLSGDTANINDYPFAKCVVNSLENNKRWKYTYDIDYKNSALTEKTTLYNSFDKMEMSIETVSLTNTTYSTISVTKNNKTVLLDKNEERFISDAIRLFLKSETNQQLKKKTEESDWQKELFISNNCNNC